MPRPFVHVLLSLLLVLTQQMSLLHVTTHWQEARTPYGLQTVAQGDTDGPGKPAKSALGELCAQCLGGAQLAYSLPAPEHVFVPLALDYGNPAVRGNDGIDPQRVYGFQPRGPPQV